MRHHHFRFWENFIFMIACALDAVCKKLFLILMSQGFALMFSSEGFYSFSTYIQVCDLFWINFVYNVKERCDFILLYVTLQFFYHHLLKWLIFLSELFLHPCQKSVVYVKVSYVSENISGLCCFPLIYLSIFKPILHEFIIVTWQ